MRRSRPRLGPLLAITAGLWCAPALAQPLPALAAEPPSPTAAAGLRLAADDDTVSALRNLEAGGRLTTRLEDLADAIAPLAGASGLAEGPEGTGRGADSLAPAAPEGLGASRPYGAASDRTDGPLGKLVGPTFGDGSSVDADWALSVGLRKDARRRAALPGAGPEEELGLGAGVRVGLSEGVTLGGGYGYFSDEWSGYLRDERSSARPADVDDLGTNRNHHVAGLRLTFEFEPSPALR